MAKRKKSPPLRLLKPLRPPLKLLLPRLPRPLKPPRRLLKLLLPRPLKPPPRLLKLLPPRLLKPRQHLLQKPPHRPPKKPRSNSCFLSQKSRFSPAFFVLYLYRSAKGSLSKTTPAKPVLLGRDTNPIRRTVQSRSKCIPSQIRPIILFAQMRGNHMAKPPRFDLLQ